MLRIIDAHNTLNPMFIYMAFQNVHGPTQVPENYTAEYVDPQPVQIILASTALKCGLRHTRFTCLQRQLAPVREQVVTNNCT